MTRSRIASSEPKLLRFNRRRHNIPNQISIWFSHEQCFGVYTNRMRCAASDKNAARLSIDFSMPLLPFTPKSSVMPHNSATSRTNDSLQCVFKLSATNIQFDSGSVAKSIQIKYAKSSSVRVSFIQGNTLPDTTHNAAIKHNVPCRMYSYSLFA